MSGNRFKTIGAIALLISSVYCCFPKAADAQTSGNQQVLQPVSKWQDRNPADEDISPCFDSLAFVGANDCGSIVTQADIDLYGTTFRGLSLSAGDVLRGEQRGSVTDRPIFTVLRQNGSAISAQESFGGALTRSQTSPDGTTTATVGASVGERVEESVEETAEGFVSSVADPLIKGFVTVIGEIIVKVSTWFLGIAGVLLNFAIVKTVFEFSTLIGNSPGLLTAWGILRDIANMALLFGFIFLGLATILDLKKFSGSEAKKAIPRLLIFAVLMNFSLFGAQAVIDVSNALSSAMYNQANTSTCGEASTGANETVSFDATTSAVDSLGNCASDTNVGLAGNFIAAAGLAGVFDFFGDTGTNFSDASLGTIFVVYIGLALFTIIAALVFMAAAIMLIIRSVVLTFLMVVAPLGFAALAIPQLEKVGKDWWNRLIHQSFFAPILLLFILVSLKITEGIGGVGGDGLAAVLTRPDSSMIGAVLVFAIVIGFLVASLVAAKKFGAMGADFATKTAGRFALGGAAVVGRQTIGRSSMALAGQIRSSRFGSTEIGRRLAGVADKGGKSSFDLRATKVAQNVAKAGSLQLGEARKGGLKQSIEDQKKKRVEYAKTIGSGVVTQQMLDGRIKVLDSEKKSADDKLTKAKEKLKRTAEGSVERAAAEKEVNSATQEAFAAKEALEKVQKMKPGWQADDDLRKAMYADTLKKSVPEQVQNKKTGEKNRRNIPSRVLAPSLGVTPLFNASRMLGVEAATKAINDDIKKSKKKLSAKELREFLDDVAPPPPATDGSAGPAAPPPTT